MNRFLTAGMLASMALAASAGIVQLGSGSYADSFPGTDSGGRNGYIGTNPYVSGNAANKPIPTSDWWSNELLNAHATSIFNYPLALRPMDDGLVILNNVQNQAIADVIPFKVSVESVTAASTTVSDHSDWTVTINWGGTENGMEATIGNGMPFVYFTKSASGNVRIDVQQGTLTVDGNIAYVSDSYNRASYAAYAPAGSTWTRNGNVITSNLGGKNYWSVIMLPQGYDAAAGAKNMEKYAFVFPKNTRIDWSYNAAAGTVNTTYKVETEVKEGSNTAFPISLLPHHWGNVVGTPNYISGMTYSTVRGELRLAEGNQFSTSLKYQGVLPYLPSATESTAFSKTELKNLVDAITANSGFEEWTDSYNDGQLFNRMLQTAEAAKASGDEEGFNTAYNLVKTRLERWLSCTSADNTFMFYYHKPWTTLIGYPPGYGSDTNNNDHHFHYGYFLRAAAFVAQYDHNWAAQWGDMVNMLVRDIASADRDDSMFPFLRNFSPFAGHAWANGTCSSGLGNDEESSSESMNFNNALILWGDVTGNTELRDLGVFLYTTERSAIEEYWFDVHGRNLVEGYNSALACRVYTNGYDAGNFWGGGIAGSYGIEIYPVHAGSFYLMNDADYAAKLWNAMSTETGILSNEANDNIWCDTWIRFLAMQDSQKAIDLYNSCNRLGVKFGESQALTYQWIYAMQQLGTPDMDITANHPLAMAFDKNGSLTYVARNNTASSLVVTYSDGYVMTVAPYSLGVEKANAVADQPSVALTVESETIQKNLPIVLNANVTIPSGSNVSVSRVEFVADNNTVATATAYPYQCTWTPATVGTHSLYAKLYTSNGKNYTSDVVEIEVVEAGTTPSAGNACSTIDTEASEGTFAGAYTVNCQTVNGSAVVTASFAGDYTGFAGPWLFNETEGFAEVGMSDNGDGTFSYVFSNYAVGSEIKFRIKIAFAGGLAVTKYITYEVGKACDGASTAVKDIATTSNITVFPNPTTTVWNVSTPYSDGSIRIWDITGRLMGNYSLDGGNAVINASSYAAGRYIMQVVSSTGAVSTANLLKH
jgi:endoglucanase Acf2